MAVPRNIVRQLREGTFQKSGIGARAREVASDREREPVARDVVRHADTIFERPGSTNQSVNRDRMERHILGDRLFKKQVGNAEFERITGRKNADNKNFPGMSVKDLRAARTMSSEEWKERARQDAQSGKKRSPFFYH